MTKKVLVCLFCLGLWFSSAFADTLYTTNQIWEDVKLIGGYAEDDPLFSDTLNVRATLIRDAYGWVQNLADGYTYLDVLSLWIDTDTLQYPLEASGFVNEVLPIKIRAVRRKDPTNPPSLTSASIGDFNKPYDKKGSYPDYYATDYRNIWFNSKPAADTTMYIYAYRQASTDSACVWGRLPPLFSQWRHVLILKVVALCKLKEGNEVAEHNINQVVGSMVADLIQTYQMIEGTKELRIRPQIFEE